jgi:hypothetical protein
MKKPRIAVFGLAALLILLLAGVARAGSSANYAINWQVFSGGGAPASAGNVSLNGSLGQTAIGLSSGGPVKLGAGFWSVLSLVPQQPQAAPQNQITYLPLIFRN